MVVAGPRAPWSRKVGFLQFSKWHVSDCAFYVSLSIADSCQVLSNLVDSCESGAAEKRRIRPVSTECDKQEGEQ